MMDLSPIAQADPLPLPAPAWLLWTLLMLTFVLHVIPMNLVLGGSLLSAFARLRGDRSPHQDRLSQITVKAMPVAIAAAVTFGVAPLLFVQVLYGRLFFTSSVLMAWWWISVVPLLLVAYYGAYLLAFKGGRAGEGGVLIATVMAACFITIAFIYSNNMSLMLRPETFVGKFRAGGRGFLLNAGDATLLPRYLHMLLGAVGVAGLAVALLGAFRSKAEPGFGAWAMRLGMAWAVPATVLNVVVGFWWFLVLPRDVAQRFEGGNPVATGSLVIGIVAALALTGLLVQAWRSPAPERLVKGSLHGMLLTLVAMVIMRDHVRQGALEASGFQPVTWVEPQWGVIGAFLLLLVAALGTVAWLVKVFVEAGGRVEKPAEELLPTR